MTHDRREFLTVATGALSSVVASGCRTVSPPSGRWRGFNLQEKFTDTPAEWATVAPEWGRSNERFREQDFEWMSEWGFNFVRLPMSYRCWTDPNDPYRLIESTLQEIEQAILWGKQYGIHVCLNFHRAPGFCINQAYPREPWNLWTDREGLHVFVHHWRHFAQRFRGFSSQYLSFNLLNEPNRCTASQYAFVIREAVQAIRSVDPERLVMVDGLFGEAILPVKELADLSNAVHSTRGYAPFALTHYLAPWGGAPSMLPTWPLMQNGQVVWDKQVLRRWCIQPSEEIEQMGARIFVGEWGCWNKTPHAIALAWMRDFLELWKQKQWGWALWCFRGSFGVLDSNRADVRYENWKGHKLDREMLELLQAF